MVLCGALRCFVVLCSALWCFVVLCGALWCFVVISQTVKSYTSTSGLCGLVDLKNDVYSLKTYFGKKVSKIFLLSIAFFYS